MRRGPYLAKARQRSRPRAVPKASAVDSLLWQIRELTPGIPTPTREFLFHPQRKYRFDICWSEQSIAAEIDGGIWTYGRHNRATGMVEDMKKSNEAVIYGYRVLHFRPEEIVTADGRIIEDAIKVITQLFKTLGFTPGKKLSVQGSER